MEFKIEQFTIPAIIMLHTIVMTFFSDIAKFRASTYNIICVAKGKLQEGQKNGKNGTHKPRLAPYSDLIFDIFVILK